MTNGDWLAVAMGILYVGAVVAYGLNREWAKAIYFSGVTILTVGILMME